MSIPPLSSPLSPKPFFLLPRSPKGLDKLVTKAKGLRWPKVRELARVALGQRRRARARRSCPCQRPRVQKLHLSSRMLLLRPKMLLKGKGS